MATYQPNITTTTDKDHNQLPASDSMITEQPINPISPIIPEDMKDLPPSELSLLVAFAMVLAVLAAQLKN